MKGFSLIEILLVIALIGLLGYLTLPIGIEFYRTLALDSVADQILQTLRSAQAKATASQFDSSFGVYIGGGQYTLFKGDTYLTRDAFYDENFEVNTNISFSGLNEVTFSRLTGLPSNTGDIILNSYGESLMININEVGIASLKLASSQTLVLRVQSPGDENGLSQYPNSQQHWDKVVEDPSDDDLTYVYRNGSNQRKDLYEIEDTALSADLIKEVVIYFNCKKVASAGIDGLAASFVKTNNQTFDGQTNMITDTYALYAQSYSVNPNTAAEWTWSEINNLQIGVSLNTTGNNTNSARCTQVWAEVESVSSF